METVGKLAERIGTATGTTPPGQNAPGVLSLTPNQASVGKAAPKQARAASPLAEKPSQGKEAPQKDAPNLCASFIGPHRPVGPSPQLHEAGRATGATPGQNAPGVPSLTPNEVSDDKAEPKHAQVGPPLAEMPIQGKEAP